MVVTALGFQNGNPNLVLYPYDEEARQCGRDTYTTHPYLYFYAAVSNLKEFNITGIAQGVCVSECPKTYTGTLKCLPTTKNPSCTVKEADFYVSVPCKNRYSKNKY